jgi:hypothetical protein
VCKEKSIINVKAQQEAVHVLPLPSRLILSHGRVQVDVVFWIIPTLPLILLHLSTTTPDVKKKYIFE